VAVFTIRIDDAIGIDRSSVDTPFEGVGMIRDARYRPVWIASAALGVRVLELPFDSQSWAELGDEILLWTRRIRGGPIRRTERRDVTVRAEAAVVVVLDHDGVSAAVGVDRDRAIPAKSVRLQEGAICSCETHEMALGVVITAVGAEEDAAVGRDRWR